MQQHTKRGNPYHFPKKRKRRQSMLAVTKEQCAPSPAVRSVALIERARLTLHDSDPITGNEDTLYTLFYEFYRGYTIYSTEQGRCCIHGQQGCLRLRGKFIYFPNVEEAKTFIKRLRAEGYTSSDPVERNVSASAYVCLNRHEPQMDFPISASQSTRLLNGEGQASHLCLPHKEAAIKETGL